MHRQRFRLARAPRARELGGRWCVEREAAAFSRKGEAVADKTHIHDWHATILHLLGLDHEKLTFRHAGREMRLTDVKGHEAREILG
jgi:hypothetical protein